MGQRYLLKEVNQHFILYQTEKTISGGRHPERFGQWWWKRYGASKVGMLHFSQLFHEENHIKALQLICENFLRNAEQSPQNRL